MVDAETERVDLLALSPAQLRSALAADGEPAYRATQIFHWLHQRGVLDPARMSDLPAALRERLADRYRCQPLELADQRPSADGSVKFVWRTAAGQSVESVLMPGFDYGCAVCVSCHSGCPLHCGFCATGRMGHASRLSASEILHQLYGAEGATGLVADRVVFMGMGEPLLNLDAVHRAVDLLVCADGRAWSPRRITISTAGLLKPLLRLADGFPRVNLALSLHFTTAEARNRHMPGCESSPARLAEALYYYRQANGGKISIEYAPLDGLNDGPADIRRLTEFAALKNLDRGSELFQSAAELPAPARQQPLPLHVNLVEYNPIGVAEYRPSPPRRLEQIAAQLAAAGVPVSVRHSRGRDVAAACGMLGARSA